MNAQVSRGSPNGATAASTSTVAPNLTFAYAMIGLALVGIWVSVALASIFSPDMVTGYYHEHHPIAAYSDWLWGIVATGFVVTGAALGIRRSIVDRMPWTVIGVGVSVVWIGAALISIFTPVSTTGTDPTVMPYGAILAPIVATILTGIVTNFAKTSFQSEPAVAEPTAQTNDSFTKLMQLTALRDQGLVTPEEYQKKKADLLSRL